MAKLLRIDDCRQCPACVERDDGPCLSDGRAYGCSDVSDEDGRPTSIDNGYDIPNWCPLPEAEEVSDGAVEP